MGIETGTALLISAAIGAGTAAYSAQQQKKQASKSRAAAQRLQEEAKRDDKLIRDASAAPETATYTFGSKDEDTSIGTFDEFISPTNKRSSGLGITNTTGRTSSTGLGFNV